MRRRPRDVVAREPLLLRLRGLVPGGANDASSLSELDTESESSYLAVRLRLDVGGIVVFFVVVVVVVAVRRRPLGWPCISDYLP